MMQKTILLSAAMTLLTIGASAAGDNGKTSFKGKIEGLGDSLIVLSFNNNRTQPIDTVAVKDGQFDFTISVSQPQDIYICTPGTLRRKERKGFMAVAVPGESAVINGDLSKNYYFSGSKFYQQYDAIDRANEAAMRPIMMLQDSLTARMKNGEPESKVMDEYYKKEPALLKTANEQMLAFIAKNTNSEGVAAYIPRLSDLEMMKKAAGMLSDEVKNGRMKPYYQHAIDDAQRRADEAEAQQKKQGAGVEAPNFTLNDLNGKPLSLASLKGKYVLLDFWGTWCIWCVRGIPKMKEYYNKYKGKYEILSIDCNETQDKWKAGVKKYELPWLNVYCPNNATVLEDYGITGFPTKILIGPDGKIVKTFIGEDPAFYEFLDEQFK